MLLEIGDIYTYTIPAYAHTTYSTKHTNTTKWHYLIFDNTVQKANCLAVWTKGRKQFLLEDNCIPTSVQ